MQLTVCGIPRSGSTLLWQLASTIYPNIQIPQTHPAAFKPDGSTVLISIRNPYDIGASRYRLRQLRSETDNVANLLGLEAELSEMKKHFDGLKVIKEYADARILQHADIHLFRYEEFYMNFDIIFNFFKRRFGTEISELDRYALDEKFSLEKNRQRCLSGNKKILDEFHLQVGHVGIGIPGTWRTIVPPWGYALMDKWCRPIADQWGYKENLK